MELAFSYFSLCYVTRCSSSTGNSIPLAFVWQWNDYIFITLSWVAAECFYQVLELLAPKVISEVTGGTAATKLQGDQYESLINNTGMLLVIAPLLILYAFMQKYFIESVARSGIVG